MKTGRLLAWLGVAVCVLALGTAGYALYVNYTKRQELARQLATTRATLEERQRALTTLEAQRQHLAQQYEDAQRRQTASEADVVRLTQERQRLNTQVTTLSKEHSEASKALQETDTQLATLREKLASLDRAHQTLQEEKQTLERAVMQRDAKSLTTAELEQVSKELASQDTAKEALVQQLADLSGDYERLAQDRRQLVQGIDAHPPEPGTTWASQLASWATGLGAREETLASRYKELGEGYLRLGDYARAAEAFEQSLKLREDPELHTQLTFLYSRFLHNADLAGQHAAVSPMNPSMRPGDSARAQRMPRSGWQLLRDWLTQ